MEASPITDVESKVQALLKKNSEFSETWNNPITMDMMRPMSWSTGGALIILTCLDPRVVTEQFLGPNLGLPVYRNAGGRATEDAVRSILILKSLIGASAVLVIHHTDCGKTHIIEEELREDAKKRTPEAASEIDAYPSFRVGPASDFEKMIKEDVQILRSTSALAGVEIRGFGMDTATGLITELTIE